MSLVTGGTARAGLNMQRHWQVPDPSLYLWRPTTAEAVSDARATECGTQHRGAGFQSCVSITFAKVIEGLWEKVCKSITYALWSQPFPTPFLISAAFTVATRMTRKLKCVTMTMMGCFPSLENVTWGKLGGPGKR